MEYDSKADTLEHINTVDGMTLIDLFEYFKKTPTSLVFGMN